MPVTVVVGGQFGSEGKGKTALYAAQERHAAVAIRVGGPNSGHTVVRRTGDRVVFRQLPTAALLPGVLCVLPAGSYIDTSLLLREIALANLAADRLIIDPSAMLVTEDDRRAEGAQGLRDRIGSTGSGTGSAVAKRIARDGTATFAYQEPDLRSFIRPVASILRDVLAQGERIVVEGSQGFGLSVLHGPEYPYVTSRDTTASGCVAESGLSPLDVDEVILVLRTFPIRVPGTSGRLPNEIDWPTVTAEAGSDHDLIEHTSVTRGVRRVARFDPEIVRQAIAVNNPNCIVLNHLDYVDAAASRADRPLPKVSRFVEQVETSIGRPIDLLGWSAVADLVDARRWQSQHRPAVMKS